MRKTKEELDALKKEKGVDVLWSFSRFDTFRTSPFEYMLKYIKHIPEDKNDCIYASCGTLCHDTLDKYYEREIPYEKMIEEFEDGWVVNRDISMLCFDRNDSEKDKKLADKYYENLVHFFKNHKPIEADKVIIEPFVHLNVEDRVFIGYIDALYKDSDDCYNIIDFKSSSIYSGQTLINHSTQLILYAMALIQNGIPLSHVKIAFDFLKYTTVEYMQANGKVKSRNLERSKIGESLQSVCKTKLKKYGCNENEINEYLKLLLDTNSIECLPKEVQKEFTFSDCYVFVPLDQKLIDKTINEIITVLKDIELREKDYEETHNENIFFDTEDQVKANSYYFANLSGYSAALHKPYKKYLEKLEAQKSSTDFFGGVGINSSNVTSTLNNKEDELNLDWLNDL